MENACHFKPKAKYPIKVDEKKGDIINQYEHKRRLYIRNMLVISNPLKIPFRLQTYIINHVQGNTCYITGKWSIIQLPCQTNMINRVQV